MTFYQNKFNMTLSQNNYTTNHLVVDTLSSRIYNVESLINRISVLYIKLI